MYKGTRTFTLAGRAVIFDPTGAAFLPNEKALLLADLHFEKGSSYADKGIFLPPYDTAHTLQRLEAICQKFRPQRIISLGDAFHDRNAEERMAKGDIARLARLCAEFQFDWITGNHDPEPPQRFAGLVADRLYCGKLILTHAPTLEQRWNIAGHLHPCAKIQHENGIVRRRCFISDGHRLILPSFGAYTGGLNILDPAYAGLFAQTPHVFITGKTALRQIPWRALRSDHSQTTSPTVTAAK